MRTYLELKVELEQIANLVEKFPEAIKPKVYDLLVANFLGNPQLLETQNSEPAKPKSNAQVTAKNNSSDSRAIKASRKTGAKESYQLDRELNLRGDKSIPSFKAFVEEKIPVSNPEFNAVAVYYLQKLLGSSEITLNQLYTCYSEVGRRQPEAFKQSFIDTKNKKGWVEFDESGNLRIPHRGVVFVEHDLPAQTANKKAK